jgi:hypothetical protein
MPARKKRTPRAAPKARKTATTRARRGQPAKAPVAAPKRPRGRPRKPPTFSRPKPVVPLRGGWTGDRLQLSTWIREQLQGGDIAWAQRLHRDYVEAMAATPLKTRARTGPGRPAKGGKRKTISSEGFRMYVYILKKLGLIERVENPGISEEPEVRVKRGAVATRVHPDLSKRQFFRAVLSRLNDPAWENPQEAYRNMRGSQL